MALGASHSGDVHLKQLMIPCTKRTPMHLHMYVIQSIRLEPVVYES
jgi:hypothetical protein